MPTSFSTIPYLGDAPGRKVGDIVFAASAPNVSFLAADGSHTTPTTGATALAAQSQLWNISANVVVNDSETTASSDCVISGGNLYYANNAGAIKHKVPNGSGTGAISTDSTNADWSSTNSAGWQMQLANGIWYRCYTSIASGLIQVDWASAPGGGWTTIASAPFTSGYPQYGIWYSPSSGKWYCSSVAGLHQSSDGKTGWTAIGSAVTSFRSFCDVGGVLYFFGDSGLVRKISSPYTSSTDYTATSTGSLPDSGIVVYNPVVGKFFGMASSAMVSSTNPTSTWTDESLHNYSGTVGRVGAILVRSSGLMVAVGNQACTWSRGDGFWGYINTGGPSGSYSFWTAVDFDTYLHVYESQSRPLLIDNGLERFRLPTIASLNGLTAYIKVSQ
jgi:hypothetical protein